MKKAIIEGWFSGRALTVLKFNREGLLRLRAALEHAERHGKGRAEDDEKSVLDLVCDDSLTEKNKKLSSSERLTYLGFIICYLMLAGLVVLGILKAYEYIRR